tara:strand:+ start:97 stop:753 length:657 start_codon:yes stop_codon:yes gene_type:complete
MTTIFDILDKAGNINRPKSRNAGRYAKGKKVERKFGTKTPSDADIKARAASDRASRFAAAKLSRTAATNAGKKPKSPTATKQPKAKKQVKISGKFSKEGASRIASANANNSRANVAGETSASTVGRGDSYGGAARAVSRKKSVECRLWKAELNNTFNTLLDNYQSKYKTIFDERAANSSPAPKITNTGRSGKGSIGADTTKKPKAMGESKEDQAVMQS